MAACSDNNAAQTRAALARATTTTTSSTTTTLPPTTTTTAPPPTIVAPPAGLGIGARGPEVQALEERLAALKYEVGTVDDRYDSNTHHGVMAFQKVSNLNRTGRATDDVLQALATATEPPSLVPGGGETHVEVDLPRQVLFLWSGHALYRILSISTGNNKRYCVDGRCAIAVTPGGSFRMSRFDPGWTTSRLGRLYNAVYFNGGIAVHGSTSVPGYPASHGCVRIPMSAAEWFPTKVFRGTPVYVVGGHVAPVPFDEPTPGEAPPTSEPAPGPAPVEPVPTTTTTAPPPTPQPTIPIP